MVVMWLLGQLLILLLYYPMVKYTHQSELVAVTSEQSPVAVDVEPPSCNGSVNHSDSTGQAENGAATSASVLVIKQPTQHHTFKDVLNGEYALLTMTLKSNMSMA